MSRYFKGATEQESNGKKSLVFLGCKRIGA